LRRRGADYGKRRGIGITMRQKRGEKPLQAEAERFQGRERGKMGKGDDAPSLANSAKGIAIGCWKGGIALKKT